MIDLTKICTAPPREFMAIDKKNGTIYPVSELKWDQSGNLIEMKLWCDVAGVMCSGGCVLSGFHLPCGFTGYYDVDEKIWGGKYSELVIEINQLTALCTGIWNGVFDPFQRIGMDLVSCGKSIPRKSSATSTSRQSGRMKLGRCWMLSRNPQNVKADKFHELWYYEQSGGIEIYLGDPGGVTHVGRIPWWRLRKSLKRKDADSSTKTKKNGGCDERH